MNQISDNSQDRSSNHIDRKITQDDALDFIAECVRHDLQLIDDEYHTIAMERDACVLYYMCDENAAYPYECCLIECEIQQIFLMVLRDHISADQVFVYATHHKSLYLGYTEPIDDDI